MDGVADGDDQEVRLRHAGVTRHDMNDFSEGQEIKYVTRYMWSEMLSEDGHGECLRPI